MGFVGDIFGSIFGGKGGSSAPPPMPQMPDYSGEMLGMVGMMSEMMGGMMEGMMGQMEMMSQQAAAQQESMLAQMDATLQMPELPMPSRDPQINFSETERRLRNRAAADFNLDERRRKGIQDTVLTSPLLDEEEPNLGGSVLTGE